MLILKSLEPLQKKYEVTGNFLTSKTLYQQKQLKIQNVFFSHKFKLIKMFYSEFGSF